MSTIVEVLRSINIKYPGDPDTTPLSTLHSTKKLPEMLSQQYPDWNKTGHVQFIPEARGFERYFLKKEEQTEERLHKHHTDIAGVNYEIKVQGCFSSLKGSTLLQDSSLLVMHNIKKETIRHKKLQNLWNNEVDILAIDRNYGIFICEVKQRSYLGLKESKSQTYNLDVELSKQEKRYQLFSKLRAFSGVDVPIHTVLFCNSRDSSSHIVEEGTEKRNKTEHKFVVDLYPDAEFSVIWTKILCFLGSVRETLSENITLFSGLIYAIQHIGELSPSVLHQQFVEQFPEDRGGKQKKIKVQNETAQNKMSVIWSREQAQIIDHVTDSFEHQLRETDTSNLKLCITGPMGSGKTLLLRHFAEQFLERFPAEKVLILIADIRYTLLLDSLRAIFGKLGGNITIVPQKGHLDYTRIGAGSTGRGTALTFCASCAEYKLILVDEFSLRDGQNLDVSHVTDNNIVLVTSLTETAARLSTDFFTCFKLSGSLRSTREIVEYVRKQQAEDDMDQKAVLVSPAHNTSYRDVTTTHTTTGEECIQECIARIQELLRRDSKVTILVISIIPRWLLYHMSQRLIAKDIPHNFKCHNIGATDLGHGSENITLCDSYEATGYESCAAIFITDTGRISAGHVAGITARCVSRATTVAHVIKIDRVYSEDMPATLPTSLDTDQTYKIPCYVDVGQRNCEGLIESLKNIVDREMKDLAISHNKKILVAYNRFVITMIEDIKPLLPNELIQAVTFECYHDYKAFDCLDFSKDFILLVQCWTFGYQNVPQRTVLPVRDIELLKEQ